MCTAKLSKAYDMFPDAIDEVTKLPTTMSNNDETSAQSRNQNLAELMDETERTAVRTLIHDSVTEPVPGRERAIDGIFSVLSHPGRRYILTYLLRSDGYVTMSELVDYVVAASEREASDPELRQKVAVNLTHTHLPLLDEEGFITYNMERQLIQPTAKTELVGPYLKVALLQSKQLSEISEP